MDAGPTNGRRAKVRLRWMSVHAVALVKDGANLTRWASIRKAFMSDTTTPTTEAAPASKALVLPKAAQETIISALGQALEALSACLDLAKGAQTSDDPAATVPPEYTEQLERIGMALAALADQFEGGAGDLPPDSAALTPEEMVLAKQVAKAHAVALVKSFSAVSKGKVKMSFEQAMKLHGGLLAKLYSIVNDVAPLISEFGGEPVAAALGAPTEPEETNKSAPTTTTTTTQSTATDAHVARLERGLNGLQTIVHRVAKERGIPTHHPAPRDNAQPAPTHTIPYGQNLSRLVKERQGGDKTNNGAAGAAAGGASS